MTLFYVLAIWEISSTTKAESLRMVCSSICRSYAVFNDFEQVHTIRKEMVNVNV